VLADDAGGVAAIYSPTPRKVAVHDDIHHHACRRTPTEMYLSRAGSGFVCNACQRAAVRRSKSALNGITRCAPLKATAAPRRTSRCAFSTASSLGKDRNDPAAEDPEFAFLDEAANTPKSTTDAIKPTQTVTETSLPTDFGANETVDDVLETVQSQKPASTGVDTSIPWYLRQNAAAREAQKPIEIPDLPHNPPPLLKTILEYISITAGLDDLELLDLRHLDPPPALGPKLIMIIATARSEKHLHVAADGFARFLRREHGLKANAAGLLGRNELKIKLRRKAKRMRMLANVGGAVQEGNLDDGIRTGWICCTLSKIEAHSDDMHMPGDNVEEFVGFRSVKPGVNVVVQMFTEEKRAETDLETLWGGVLRTHQREGKAAEDKLKELDEEADMSSDAPVAPPRASEPEEPIAPVRPVRPPPSTPGDIFPPVSGVDAARQVRRLHTVGLRQI
jgi:ribosomal silencing factor RsfS